MESPTDSISSVASSTLSLPPLPPPGSNPEQAQAHYDECVDRAVALALRSAQLAGNDAVEILKRKLEAKSRELAIEKNARLQAEQQLKE